jgi:hypothetical protein
LGHLSRVVGGVGGHAAYYRVWRRQRSASQLLNTKIPELLAASSGGEFRGVQLFSKPHPPLSHIPQNCSFLANVSR